MTYEYLCKACNFTWEIDQGIKELPIIECPTCKKETAQRQINCRNFILKGTGWFSSGGY